MGRFVRAVLGGLLLASVISVAAAESGASFVDAAWIKAMKAGDVSAVVECYASDAVFWGNGAPLAKGTKEIRSSYEEYLSAYTVKDASLIEMGNETVGDKSFAWGRFVITIAPKAGGASITTSGRYTVMAKRIAGKWVYTLDHASADPPPAAQ